MMEFAEPLDGPPWAGLKNDAPIQIIQDEEITVRQIPAQIHPHKNLT